MKEMPLSDATAKKILVIDG